MTTAGETPPTTNKSWALAHLVAERGARSSSHQSPHPHIPCSTSRLAQPSRVLHRAPRTHAFDPHAQLHLQILFNPDCFARAQSDVGSSRLDDDDAPAPNPQPPCVESGWTRHKLRVRQQQTFNAGVLFVCVESASIHVSRSRTGGCLAVCVAYVFASRQVVRVSNWGGGVAQTSGRYIHYEGDNLATGRVRLTPPCGEDRPPPRGEDRGIHTLPLNHPLQTDGALKLLTSQRHSVALNHAARKGTPAAARGTMVPVD